MRKTLNMGVILLAAGSSSRLGEPKQLVEFKGKTLLQNTMDCLSPFLFDCRILILGAQKEKIQKEIKTSGFEVLTNTSWKEGMSTSLKMGIDYIQKKYPQIENILIFLCDQPFVSKDLIQSLIDKHKNNNSGITASLYGDTLGVPVVFGSSFIPELLELSGDQGARKIINKYKEEVEFVEFEKGEFDVDSPEDLKLLKELNQELS